MHSYAMWQCMPQYSVGGLCTVFSTMYLQNLLASNPVSFAADVVCQDGRAGPRVQAVVSLQMLQEGRSRYWVAGGKGRERG